MESTLLIFLIFFLLFEIFESTWQKANTFYDVVLNNFYYFKKNILLYFCLHISFIYSIFLAIYLNKFGFWMSSIIVLKFLDISFKLSLMSKLNEGRDIEDIIPMNVNISPIYRYINVLIYPITFVFAYFS